MLHHILSVLKESNTIILPGLGTLTITNQKTGELFFIPYLKFDDGSLSKFIHQKEGVDIEIASTYVHELISEIKINIDTHGEFEINGLGVFFKSDDGEFKFTQKTKEQNTSSAEELRGIYSDKSVHGAHELNKNSDKKAIKSPAGDSKIKKTKIEKSDIEKPVIEDPIIEKPVIEDTIVDEAIIEETIISESVIDEAIIEEPIIEETIIEESVIEETIIEEPVINEAIIEEPIIEETIIDEAIIVESTTKENLSLEKNQKLADTSFENRLNEEIDTSPLNFIEAEIQSEVIEIDELCEENEEDLVIELKIINSNSLDDLLLKSEQSIVELDSLIEDNSSSLNEVTEPISNGNKTIEIEIIEETIIKSTPTTSETDESDPIDLPLIEDKSIEFISNTPEVLETEDNLGLIKVNKPVKSKKKTIFLIVICLLIIGGVFCFMKKEFIIEFISSNKKIIKTKEQVKQSENKAIKKSSKPNEKPIINNASSKEESINTVELVPIPKEEKPVNIIPTSSITTKAPLKNTDEKPEIIPSLGPVSIIGGSYKSKPNAESYLQTVIKMGVTSAKIIEVKGMFRIELEKCKSLDEAITKMMKYRNLPQNAWINKL
jgi:hypothetical protein